MPLRTKYGAQPSRPSGVDSRHAAVCDEPWTMITGGMLFFLLAGTWNWTYIWPMVIWFGTFCWLAGALAGATVAYGVTFGTPPMKKLPWSSITSGFFRNFFILPFSCATTVTAIAPSNIAAPKHQPTWRRERRLRFIAVSSVAGRVETNVAGGSLRETAPARVQATDAAPSDPRRLRPQRLQVNNRAGRTGGAGGF